ncbi:MAG: hypothetical protein H5U40_05775, partial [Polyangiaceae bacterium]|nr:hypothetical protein [Polyangiaceae bacterium]
MRFGVFLVVMAFFLPAACVPTQEVECRRKPRVLTPRGDYAAPPSRGWGRAPKPFSARREMLGRRELPPWPRATMLGGSAPPVSVRADLEHPNVSPAGGKTHLRLTIVGGTMTAAPAKPTAPLPERDRVDVWLYLDSSASMSGESIRDSRAAAHALVRQLHREDRLGVVEHGEKSRLVRSLRAVGDRLDAHRAIDGISVGGPAPA